jgi:hypothetical protein
MSHIPQPTRRERAVVWWNNKPRRSKLGIIGGIIATGLAIIVVLALLAGCLPKINVGPPEGARPTISATTSPAASPSPTGTTAPKAKSYEEIESLLKDKSPRDKATILAGLTDEELKTWFDGKAKAQQTPVPAPSDLEKEQLDKAAAAKAAEEKAAAEKAAADKAAAEAAVDKRLAELGYGPNKGWTRNITDAAWQDIANNNPGLFAQGTSFAKTPEEAAAAAVNNPAVAGTREQKADPKNWVLVYNPQCMTYPNMAFQLPDGSISWGGGFTECGVMTWVNLASGGQFRLLCDNGITAPPVATTNQPTFNELQKPITKLVPPVVDLVQVCNTDTRQIVTVPRGQFGPYAPVGSPLCQPKPPVVDLVQVCNTQTRQIETVPRGQVGPYAPVGSPLCQPPVKPMCPYNPQLPPDHPNCLKPKSNNPADYKYPEGKLPVDAPPGPGENVPPVEPNPLIPAVQPGTSAPGVVAPGADPAPRPAPIPDPVAPAPTPANPGTAIPDPDAANG